MLKNTFKYYALFLIFFVTPLILANQYYIDDMGRASVGYTKWGVDGRPIADLLMSAINLSTRMVDIAPLPLLLSVLLLSVSLTLYRKEFVGDDKWGLIVPLAFFANPAMISMLSYRFDVLTFSFSISASFMMFAFKYRSAFLKNVTGTILVVIVLGTYQAVLNLISIMILCELFRNIKHGLHPILIIKESFSRAMQVIVGVFVYAKVILPITFTGEYSSNHPGITKDLIGNIKENSQHYFDFISNNFYRFHGKYIVLVSITLCIALAAKISIHYAKHYNFSIPSCMVSIVAILLSAISTPLTVAALLPLDNSLGGVHLYMPVSGFYLLLATLLFYAFEQKKLSLLIIAPLFYNILLIYSYGNSLRSQEVINNHIVDEIDYVIRENKIVVKSVIYKGAAPKSDVLKNSSINFPILNYTVIDYFWNWSWASSYLSMKGIKQKYLPSRTSAEYLNNICNLNKIYDGSDFNSFYVSDVLIVDFSKKHCTD